MSLYSQRLFGKPMRVRVISALLAAAAWLARPKLFGVKILEHYDVSVEIDVGALSSASYDLNSSTIRINSFRAFGYRRKALNDIERMLAEAEAQFLGAGDQNPKGKDPFK